MKKRIVRRIVTKLAIYFGCPALFVSAANVYWDGSEDSSFGDFLEDGDEHTPSESAMHKLLKDKINHVLKSLTYREREIIKLRYGLGDGYSYTLEETGRIFKVTRERIRQIESKALRKLQHHTRAAHLKGFVESLKNGQPVPIGAEEDNE